MDHSTPTPPFSAPLSFPQAVVQAKENVADLQLESICFAVRGTHSLTRRLALDRGWGHSFISAAKQRS